MRLPFLHRPRRAAAAAALAAGLTALLVAGPAPRAAGTDGGVTARALPPILADAREVALKAPEAVASDGARSLAVADTGNGRLLLYDFAAGQATPRSEIRLPQISYPIGVQFLPGGDLVVLDGRTRRLVRLTASGEMKGVIDPHGEAAGGTLVPKSFKVGPEGSIFLLDVAGARVLVLGEDGAVARSIALPRGALCPADLAVDDRGDVFVLETIARRVDVARPGETVFAPLGSPFADDAEFPTGLAAGPSGLLAISDHVGHGLVFLGPDGSFRGRQSSMGWKVGFLRYPAGLAFAPPSYLLVADRGNNRVQVFQIEE